MSNFKINTITTPLKSIQLEITGGIAENGSLSRVNCEKANIKGIGDVQVTERFMTSLAGLMGLGPSVYRYFKPEEVFDRVIKTASRNTNIQVSIDHNNNLLAAISPGKETLGMGVFNEIMDMTHPQSYRYDNGVIKFLYGIDHNGGMMIGGEDYKKQFTMTIPLDGYGPAISNLAMLRKVCANGMELLTSLFSSRVGLGSKGKRAAAIINYVQNFNGDESFSTIEDRLVTAMASPASLGEYTRAAAIVRAAGIKASVVTHKTDVDEEVRKFRAGETEILFNVFTLVEGFDCPELRTVFVRDSSKGPTIQMAGRGLRTFMELGGKWKVANLVQSRNSKNPFNKFADARSAYIMQHGEWLLIKGKSKLIEATVKTNTKLALLGEISPGLAKLNKMRKGNAIIIMPPAELTAVQETTKTAKKEKRKKVKRVAQTVED